MARTRGTRDRRGTTPGGWRPAGPGRPPALERAPRARLPARRLRRLEAPAPAARVELLQLRGRARPDAGLEHVDLVRLPPGGEPGRDPAGRVRLREAAGPAPARR